MIRCQGLQWGPPGRPLTPALDLHLAAGSLTAITGANGCGKSSLLKVIAGLQKPLTGQLQVAAPARGGIAFLLQQQAFDRQFPISLGELVASGLWRQSPRRWQRREQLEQVLAAWRLDGLADLPLEALSGGQLQRALLARLDLTQAPLLLLDEPEAALDSEGQALFWTRTRNWQQQGRTLLVVSHAVAELPGRVEQTLQISAEGCRLLPAPVALERVA